MFTDYGLGFRVFLTDVLLNGVVLWLLMEEPCKCNGGSWLDCCDKHKVFPMGSWRFYKKKKSGNLIVGFQTMSGLYTLVSGMMFFTADKEMVA